MHFSVVIPTYNRAPLLARTLESVWRQRFRDYEVIVVDDGSNDGTMEYLRSVGGPIKALHQKNKGAGSARNLGVSNAIAEYVAFLDSDDVWFPWTLATFREVIHKHNRPSLISAATIEFQDRVPNIEREEFAAECFEDYLQTANDPAYVGSGTLVVKRSIFDQIGGFDVSLSVGEDLDFYFRAGIYRNFVRVRAPVTLGYRRHPGNISLVPMALYPAAVELLKREANGLYPGGKERQTERWKLLSRIVRPVALLCLKAGLSHEAWQLYRQSFVMNARLQRFRFLAGFVVYWIIGLRLVRRYQLNTKEF